MAEYRSGSFGLTNVQTFTQNIMNIVVMNIHIIHFRRIRRRGSSEIGLRQDPCKSCVGNFNAIDLRVSAETTDLQTTIATLPKLNPVLECGIARTSEPDIPARDHA